jgi:hypothetical protein
MKIFVRNNIGESQMKIKNKEKFSSDRLQWNECQHTGRRVNTNIRVEIFLKYAKYGIYNPFLSSMCAIILNASNCCPPSGSHSHDSCTSSMPCDVISKVHSLSGKQGES